MASKDRKDISKREVNYLDRKIPNPRDLLSTCEVTSSDSDSDKYYCLTYNQLDLLRTLCSILLQMTF